MTTSKSTQAEVIDSLVWAGKEIMASALYAEVMRVRAFIPRERGLQEADELLGLIGHYLDGEIPCEECIKKQSAMEGRLFAAPITINHDEQAIKAFQRACVYLPLTTYRATAEYPALVLRELNEFHGLWTPGIDLEQVREGQLERLKAADEVASRRMLLLSIPELRDRISLLAN
jgi:hypothetical protein